MRKAYINTSFLIRAVSPLERGFDRAYWFLGELMRRKYILVVSSLHFEEGLKPVTERRISCIMDIFGIRVVEVDVHDYLVKAALWVHVNNYSLSRVFDVAHMMIARDIGCKYIVAIDKFIGRNTKKFNLVYINYYTGVPHNDDTQGI